ncbi:MAG: hypothetical protein GXY83_37995, partial [Rhodopirellula sp.]|nr:hypothetical protein [Rhodopirellula sp.]
MTAISRPLSQNTTRLVMAESAASVILAFWLCAAVVLAFMVAWPDCRHWFVLPLLCCGVIVGADAMDWLLGRVGLFDPIGVIGIVGLHFFFLAPLLHVVLDYWCVDVIPPPDWRYWLGVMALLNLCGLLAYRVARNVGGAKGFSKVWVLDRGMFFALVSVLLVASATLQCYVYALFGGVQEYIAAATGPDREEAFRGFGKIFMISESFPILAMMLFAVYAHSRGGNWRRSGIAVFVALACFLVATFFFGGLRGSRSTIVWNLAWAAGIAHVWLRPISMRSALVAGAFLMSFMYLYGFFKDAGT